MTILIVLIVASVIGIGVVLWLLKNEQEQEPSSEGQDQPGPAGALGSKIPQDPSPGEEARPKFGLLLKKLTSAKKKSADPAGSALSGPASSSGNFFQSILEKFHFGKKNPDLDDIPDITPLPGLKRHFGDENKQEAVAHPEEPQTGTAAIKTAPADGPAGVKPLSDEEEKSIEKEIEVTTRLHELEEKYGKLNVLFDEKSAELGRAQESLNSELKNRKEFNKVRDILEKELKDSKEKTRGIQAELNHAQTEADRHKNRIAQLEEKITKLEKDILGKEDKIGDLVKRLQTFASPSTAATPPAPQEPPKPFVHSSANDKKEDPGAQNQPQQPGGRGGTEMPQTSQEPVRDETHSEEAPSETGSPVQEEKSSPGAGKKPQPYEPPQVLMDKKEGGEEPESPEGPYEQAQESSGETPSEDSGQPIQEEPFLKLQPDILSQEPPPSVPDRKNEGHAQQPAKKDTDDQQADQHDNHNTRKEE